MRFRITTDHADFEGLFGGQSIIVEHAGGDCIVCNAPNPDLIGESIEISEQGDIAEQLAAMYCAEVEEI